MGVHSGMRNAKIARGPAYVVWVALLLTGAALMYVGARLGDFQAIYTNARLLCLSCMGIE